MDKVKKAYYNDEISMKAFGTEFRQNEERLEKVNAQLPDLQGEIDFLKIKYLSSEEIISKAKDLYSKWSDLVFEENGGSSRISLIGSR